MKDYHIFLVATENYQEIIKILLNSMKYYKKADNRYIIHLYLDTQKENYYQEKFNTLAADSFIIEVKSCLPYKCLIDCKTKMGYTDYVRILAPRLFPNIDKILVMDCDLIITKEGLEDFMDEDISDYYIKGVVDIPINFSNGLEEHTTKEKKQCQVKEYINLGVFELNLKKIREDGKDLQLLKADIEFPKNLQPIFNAQTICNYIFRDKIKIANPKYNNFVLTLYNLYHPHMIKYIKEWGYNSIEEYVNDSVVIHFAGLKPWNEVKESPYHAYLPIAIQVYEKFKEYFS